MSKAPRCKRARLRLPGGEILTITVHPGYVHLKRTAPRQRYFTHEVYIPRRKVLSVLRWLMQALQQIPGERVPYPPLATRLHYQDIDRLENEQRRQKREIDELRHAEAKRKRYLSAKRRARRRSRDERD